MKVINVGNRYEIYDESLKVYDKLPAQSYIVRFNKMTGFYLEKYNEFEIKENKIYGNHLDKVNKVIKSFELFDRNLGVILSGNKGIGKSLFAKLLAIKANEKGYPLIVVDSFIPGIASYLESIQQEVVVLFDEFDKTFGDVSVGNNETSPQASLLSLFDGISSGKKLFVITCNNLCKLNDYLINRPGRFHYHFRFDYPSPTEVKEYLMDKLNKDAYPQIDKIINFSKKIDLNYDCLRAIAFELNLGEKFEDCIQDLNIMNMNEERYNVTLHFSNSNETMEHKSVNLDLFSKDTNIEIQLYNKDENDVLYVEFNSINCNYDMNKGIQIVSKGNFDVHYYDDYYEEDYMKKVKQLIPDYLTIVKCKERNLHYLV